MKKVMAVFLALLMTAAQFAAEAAGDLYISLDGEWDFAYFKDGVIPEDAECTERIKVPAAVEMEGFGYPGYYFEEGRGWGMPEDDGVRSGALYRRSFLSDREGRAYIVFDSVKDDMEVRLNGRELGKSRNGAIGTTYEAKVEKGKNEIKVRVYRDKSGINKSDNFALSGIMGSVYVTDRSPYLAAETRKVEIKDGELYIDRVKTVLKGVRYTPTSPECGDVVTEEIIKKDIELIRECGFNAVWVSAAPPVFYEEAEKAGLYVVDEANVYLDGADVETAKKRILETVKRHRQYKAIVIWSVGAGDGGRIGTELIETVKKEDSRPVAQELSFAPVKEIFGNTGGIADWAKELGDGNIGGFIKEFADKELYTTKNIYTFETTDEKTKKEITVNGEIRNYLGNAYLGDGELENEISATDRFTVAAETSAMYGDRVIFESGDVKLETKDWSVCATVSGKELSADFDGGRIALVYGDGEAQLFAGEKFYANTEVDASLGETYRVGQGDGSTAIGCVSVYGDMLDLDELIEGKGEDKLISRVDFGDIKVLEDRSYKYLGYGGDFGDEPNSYYKSLKGLFTSLREPHPEAEEVKAVLTGSEQGKCSGFVLEYRGGEYVKPVMTEDGFAVMESGETKVTVAQSGEIVSFIHKGKEKLAEPLRPSTARMSTAMEMERGEWHWDEYFETKSFEIKGSVLYAELRSRGAALYIAYALGEDGELHVSMQSEFGENTVKPTFLGFRGKTEYDSVKWIGKRESVYPDRFASGEEGCYEAKVQETEDNYALPQESGNKAASAYSLFNGGDALTFKTESKRELCCSSWSYNPEEYADHDEAVTRIDGSFVRIGGYIAGVSENEEYKLNEPMYGFSMSVSGEALGEAKGKTGAVSGITIDGKEYAPFSPDVTKYVYRTSGTPKIEAEGTDAVVTYFENRCEIEADDKKYEIYFAPKDIYISDMDGELSGEISADGYFGTDGFKLGGNRWQGESDILYDKGLAMKSGSRAVYDVSELGKHVFTACIGKDASLMDGMRGWDREMFEAEAEVVIYLDGQEAGKVEGVSMFSGRREIEIDISGAKELAIEVRGNNAQYDDAVIADAKISPKGAMVLNAERKDGGASVTVLNPDAEDITVVLTASSNGEVRAESAMITKGLYRTIELDGVSDDAVIRVYVSGMEIEEF